MEALDSVITSVPGWVVLLEDLQGKIASRQYELSQLDDCRPPTRSLKNKGSTESLRPKAMAESPINFEDEVKGFQQVTSEPTPMLPRLATLPPSSAPSSPQLKSAKIPAPLPPMASHSSSPGPPASLQRRVSNRIGAIGFVKPVAPPIARKRKTASLISNESQVPKYRTRSMIIVYYDSAVQNAFEELVKQVSSCRNLMRKGKMAARMTDMRRMAEMEAGSSDEDDVKAGKPPMLDKNPMSSFMNSSRNGHVMALRDDTMEADDDSDTDLPKLQYVSTRRMGPSRDMIASQRHIPPPPARGAHALPPIPGMLRTSNWRLSGYTGSSGSGSVNIFDELDTGLEWCQSMCEHAAHQFLRDGDCGIEINGIKRRLSEVKESAEKQKTNNAAGEAANATAKIERQTKNMMMRSRGETYDGSTLPTDKGRSMRSIQMRRSTPSAQCGASDMSRAMEVDDEGFGDDDDAELPKPVWRSTRNM